MKRALLVFGREPCEGSVKTRLIPAIGAAAATRVYRALLQQALVAGATATADTRTLYLDRKISTSTVASDAIRLGFSIGYQAFGDLGARMAAAMERHHQTAQSVVLIGSDCPAYSDQYIDAAFDALQHADAVIGPASDGGYVLIGLGRFEPELFRAIRWGSHEVLAQTRERLRQLNWVWQELETLDDLDRPQDLAKHRALADIASLENSRASNLAPPLDSA
jgi:rSAM/selenodomain-associated transferase 1